MLLSEMVRGGTEAHRSSGLTTEGTAGTRDREAGSFPGATGGPMIRLVLRDDEARAEGTLANVWTFFC